MAKAKAKTKLAEFEGARVLLCWDRITFYFEICQQGRLAPRLYKSLASVIEHQCKLLGKFEHERASRRWIVQRDYVGTPISFEQALRLKSKLESAFDFVRVDMGKYPPVSVSASASASVTAPGASAREKLIPTPHDAALVLIHERQAAIREEIARLQVEQEALEATAAKLK